MVALIVDGEDVVGRYNFETDRYRYNRDNPAVEDALDSISGLTTLEEPEKGPDGPVGEVWVRGSNARRMERGNRIISSYGLRFVEGDGTDDFGKQDGEWIPYEGPMGGQGWQHVSTGEVRYQEEKPTGEPTNPETAGFIGGDLEDVPPTDVKSGQYVVLEGRRSDNRIYARVKENTGEDWTGGIGLETNKGPLSVAKPDGGGGDFADFEMVGVTDDERVARTYGYEDDVSVPLRYQLASSDGKPVLHESSFSEGDYVTAKEKDPETGEVVDVAHGIVSDVYDGRDNEGNPEFTPKLELRVDADEKWGVETFDLTDEVEVSRPAGSVVDVGRNEELNEAEAEALNNVEYYDNWRAEDTSVEQEDIEMCDEAFQRVIGATKSDKVAQDMAGEGFRRVLMESGRGRVAGGIRRRGDERKVEMYITDRTDEDTVIHETGHLLAEIYGYTTSGMASRESAGSYEPNEKFDWDFEDDEYLLKRRDKTFEGTEWYPQFAESPEEVDRLIEAVNDAWKKQREIVEDEDTAWKNATVALGYSQTNAHETLANFHEGFQTDDPYTATKVATTTLRHHPELWNAYTDVFEPSDEMQKAMQNWKTLLQRQGGEPEFERSVKKNGDLTLTIIEDGEETGEIEFTDDSPIIEYHGESDLIVGLLKSLPPKVTIPAEMEDDEEPGISTDQRITLSAQQQFDSLVSIFADMGADEIDKDAIMLKEWIPYRGPRGGEGWQNTEDLKDIRYGLEDPPGEVADGYEELAEDWGEGYYDEEEWANALSEEGWTSPDEVPEGTLIEFEANGTKESGIVTGFEWGQQFENYSNDEAYLEVDANDASYYVSADEIEFIIESGEQDSPSFDWSTDLPPVSELDEDTDVLYEDNRGIRRVGEFERPTFVETDEGTYGGVILEDGTEVQLEDMIAVDDSPPPLVPREDPYEFESVLDERQMQELPFHVRENAERWEPKLELTPFDELGEVPLGTKVEFESRKRTDPVVGEVTGYQDGNAEEGVPNYLSVETDDDYVGDTRVGPSSFRRFIGPDTEDDLSVDEQLSDPFTHAIESKTTKEMGIGDGNTTGEDMKILKMPDDSLVFATPLEAYRHITTGVVDGVDDARENNLNSPIMIEHLGGNACKTNLVRHDGKDYIVKEGIGGDILRNHKWDIDAGSHEELRESLDSTFAAAFFVGNADLHGANVKVNLDTQEATIIDHDNAGPNLGSWMDVNRAARAPSDTISVRNKIYEICRDYMRGDIDVPEELQGTKHEEYFHDALDSITGSKDNREVFEPWETSPHEPPSEDFENRNDFDVGMEVTVLTHEGRVRTAELTDEYRGTWYGETEDGYEVTFSKPESVLEVNDPEGIDVDFAEVYETFPEGYDNFGDFEEGDIIEVKERDGSEREIEVEYITGKMILRDTQTDKKFEVTDYLKRIDDVLSVNPSTDNGDSE